MTQGVHVTQGELGWKGVVGVVGPQRRKPSPVDKR